MGENRDKDVFPNPDVFGMRRERGKEEALGYRWDSIVALLSGLRGQNLKLRLVGLLHQTY
jgi:hypothetical protein